MSIATASRLARVPRTLRERNYQLNTQTTIARTFNSTAIAATGNRAQGAIHIDPADFNVLPGKTARMRLAVEYLTNDTAPGVTLTYALYTVTNPNGAAGAVGVSFAVYAPSAVALAGLAANADGVAYADFDTPPLAKYVFGIVASGSQAAASDVTTRLVLSHFWT